jgi:hypothetical protein
MAPLRGDNRGGAAGEDIADNAIGVVVASLAAAGLVTAAELAIDVAIRADRGPGNAEAAAAAPAEVAGCYRLQGTTTRPCPINSIRDLEERGRSTADAEKLLFMTSKDHPL